MANNSLNKENLIVQYIEGYMEKLFYFCLKKTGGTDVAGDLVQDISLDIIAALNKGTVPTNFSAWVWKIAYNKYAVWADKKRKQNERLICSDIEDCEIEDDNTDILDEMIRSEQLLLLNRELAFIKSDYRDVIVAYYIEDHSVRNIAESMALSEDAVKKKLQRARKILKEGMCMAREFGKLSYKPERLEFVMNGMVGLNGEPLNYLERSICKNIMIAAYRTPSTSEELAIEVGIALPYMEEELERLVNATLMKKTGNKYETNFFIVSAEAQEKIYSNLRRIAPELTKAIIDVVEFDVAWRNENCPEWHEKYQTYDDMKLALLMNETDKVFSNVLKHYNKNAVALPDIGPWGHTVRPNNGEWDILGYEQYDGDKPMSIGLSGCVSNPSEKDLPHINFRQYRFKDCKIENLVPSVLNYAEGQALVAVAKGESNTIDSTVLDRLVSYGYIEKTESGYIPKFLVMFRNKCKNMPDEVQKRLKSFAASKQI